MRYFKRENGQFIELFGLTPTKHSTYDAVEIIIEGVMRKVKADLAGKVRKYLRSLELGKKHYKRADALLREIREEAAKLPEKFIALDGSGKRAYVVDKFLEKDVVFQPVGARRYEIEIVDA